MKKVIIRTVFVGVVIILSILFVQDETRLNNLFEDMFGGTDKVWLPVTFYIISMFWLLVWMLYPLFSKGKGSKNSDKRAKQLIVIGVSCMLIVSQQNAIAYGGFELKPQYQPVTVINDLPTSEVQNLVVVNDVSMYMPDTLARTNQVQPDFAGTNSNGSQVSIGFVILAIVVVVFVAGIIYVAYKIVNAMRNILNKKNKQEKDADPDSTSSQSTPAAANGVERTTNAATFLINVPFQGIVEDYDRIQPLTVKFTPNMTNNSALSYYVPPNDELIDLADYLTYYGLSTNLENSASVNMVPTNSQNVITLHDGVISVNLGGTNRTQTFKYSYDMTNWTTIGTISVPAGSDFRFGDGFSPHPDRGFWKVIGTDQ